MSQNSRALGSGRSYDTPCIHEHSCLRCPLLRPDPTARPRLEQIRDNLIARITEAESHRWYGEAEGLKISLAGAHAKLAQMDQITTRRTTAVQLGIPSSPTPPDAPPPTRPSRIAETIHDARTPRQSLAIHDIFSSEKTGATLGTWPGCCI